MSQINAIVSKRLQIYRDFVDDEKMPEFSSAQSAFNAATMMSVTWGDYFSFGGHNDSVITMMTMATNGH